MTIRIPNADISLCIDVQRTRRPRVRFGRPNAEPALWAALLISTLSIATGVAQIAGVL
jgi:hypothetical protein